METFNSDNITCPWDGTGFQGGEQGMKCSSCGAVMKLDSWQEKLSCRGCNGREAVRVRAVSSSGRTSPRRMGTRLNPSNVVRFGSRTTVNRQENISSNNAPRNTQPPVNQRNQNQGIGISSSGSSSGTPTRNSSTSTVSPRSNPISNFGWLIGTGGIVLILSSIALPSFLNQANKAKQSEAKQYVGSMNLAQQAVFAEKTSFASKISDLGLGIKSEKDNYKYQIPQKFNNSVVVAVAEPKKSGLKGYIGIVAIVKNSTEKLLCGESQASTSFPDLSTIVNQQSPGNNVVQCPAGYEPQDSSPQSINLGSSPNSSPKEEVRSQITSPTPSVSTEQVNFDKGSTQKTISSSVVTNQTKRYSINCGSGQPMTVQIKQGDINVAIIAPNGQTIGNALKGGTKWQGQLPSDGDYIIEVSAPNQSDYIINIEVLPSKNTPASSTPATNTSLSSTPEQTLNNYYELTVKDNKAAGKKFTTDDFKKKYPSSDNNKKWVSQYNFIKVTQMKPIEQSPTIAKMTVWLLYSFKDGREQACEYRDFTLVLNNNNFLIDDIGEATQTSCP